MRYTGLLGDVLTRVFAFIPYLHPDSFPGGFE
jgi:hypothetical protein